jgi:hypothetical protein
MEVAMVDDTTAEGRQLAALLQQFLRDGRLVRLPSKFTRRKAVLRYLAMRDFRPRTWYAEPEVNEILKAWYEGAATDYVSIRRYLIDYQILDREDAGRYWLLGAWKIPASLQ